MADKLSAQNLSDVCKIGTANACAYIFCGPNGFFCGKSHPELVAQVKMKLALNLMNATCDNCPGKV